ncbi:unnamed protein product [Microthlaspi erraticum]|uniref:Uncharacterized protein n=1 Tax=Microthlaspi erraticum TaxID=1685480 RepID=A0A6D2L5N7_9BRAS|nr:unnamed protein product [Microthlaspi erraticum]
MLVKSLHIYKNVFFSLRAIFWAIPLTVLFVFERASFRPLSSVFSGSNTAVSVRWAYTRQEESPGSLKRKRRCVDPGLQNLPFDDAYGMALSPIRRFEPGFDVRTGYEESQDSCSAYHTINGGAV